MIVPPCQAVNGGHDAMAQVAIEGQIQTSHMSFTVHALTLADLHMAILIGDDAIIR